MPELAAALIGATGAGLLGGVAAGVFHPRVALFGPQISAGSSRRNAVALTFDDGPHPDFTPRIAELLEAHGARGTFFCIGRELERHAALGRALREAGHELANHTYEHSTGGHLFSAPRLEADLRRCQEVLRTTTGAECRYYRPAVGIRNPVVHRAARELGLKVVTWTDAARDGLFPLTAARAQAMGERATAGAILVFHDGCAPTRRGMREQTVKHLPVLLERLRQRGVALVTLSELLTE